MSRLRIVIPTKNEEAYLPKLLQSIKEQTFKDLEIIVADANSEDKTRKIAKLYDCKIVEGGPADVARNNGVNGCNSPLLCFIDSDVYFQNPNFLELSLREFDRRDLDIAGTIQKPLKTGHFYRDLFYTFWYEKDNILIPLFEKTKSPFMQNVMFMKTVVHKNVGGFPPYEFGEDSAIAKKAVAKGYHFGILKKPGKVMIAPRRFEEKGILKTVFQFLYYNGRIILGHQFKRRNSRINYWK
ncbi:MAG: glycosyltransferase [Nanoarchaeota archaeon]